MLEVMNMVDGNNIFYIIMLIYYLSGKLYIGYVYMMVVGDVMVCYKCLRGFDVCYLIGIDEYG